MYKCTSKYNYISDIDLVTMNAQPIPVRAIAATTPMPMTSTPQVNMILLSKKMHRMRRLRVVMS
jgi:hypothetical protein